MTPLATSAEQLYTRNDGRVIKIDAGMAKTECVYSRNCDKIHHGCDTCQMRGHHEKGRSHMMNLVCC